MGTLASPVCPFPAPIHRPWFRASKPLLLRLLRLSSSWGLEPPLASKTLQDGPERPSDGPKSLQDGVFFGLPRCRTRSCSRSRGSWALNGLILLLRPTLIPSGPRTGANSAPKHATQRAPRGLEEPSRWPREASGWPEEPPRRGIFGPSWVQNSLLFASPKLFFSPSCLFRSLGL